MPVGKEGLAIDRAIASLLKSDDVSAYCRRGYSTMFYAGTLRLEVQTRALSYTIVERTLPFMYIFHSTCYAFHIPTVRFYRP